jgi:hypothetical protein
MADHIDKQIRDAAATLLTGLATTGSNVFKSRVYPLQDAELPALRVYVDESEITAYSMGGSARPVERNTNLKIEFCGKAIASYDDAADASKKEVETALANSITLGGICKFIQLRRIETQRDDGAEQIVVVTRMIFECISRTAANAPDVPL